MPKMYSASGHLLVLTLVSWASAECRSFGWDFVDKGGPYCVDTRSSEPFSFGSGFSGLSWPTGQAMNGRLTLAKGVHLMTAKEISRPYLWILTSMTTHALIFLRNPITRK
jgi:hypothetical protein